LIHLNTVAMTRKDTKGTKTSKMNEKKEKEDEYEECTEDQEPPEDMWFCPHCSDSPCEFLQLQQEIERVVNVMDPTISNKSKRNQLYRHMSRRRFGTLGKGNRWPLPSCFEQGIRDLYPSEKNPGYKKANDSVPDDGSTNTYTQTYK
jgi:hypothetical protein